MRVLGMLITPNDIVLSLLVRGQRRDICFPDWPHTYIASRFFWGFRRTEDKFRIVDIGASCGGFTLPATTMWPNTSIVAIEPSSWSWPYFEANTEGLSIELIKEAASDKTEEVVLSLPPGEEKRIGLESVYGGGEEAQKVPARRLDDMISGSVDLIKIDVEGHELSVIEGGRGLISEYHPELIVELKDKRQRPAGHSSEDVIMELVRMGYQLPVPLSGYDFVFFTKERTQSRSYHLFQG